jgi:drug/metabolite transporter (DMT)-like permease
MDAHLGSRLRVLAAALLFSTGGAAIKACDLDAWQVASFRSAVAAVAVLAMVPAARRRWSWRIAAVGATYAATMILFVAANKQTTAANAIFLQSASPLYIVLLGPWLLREPLRRRDLVFLAVMAAGLLLFFVGAPPVYASAPQPARGNLLALLSGVCWAFTVIGLRWMGREETRSAGATATTVVAGNVIAFLACLPFALPVAGADAGDWAVIVYLGVFQIGLAYVFLSRAMRDVPAFEASLLLLAEPAFNPIWAWAVQGEVPGLWASLGGALILGATAVKAALDYRATRRDVVSVA